MVDNYLHGVHCKSRPLQRFKEDSCNKAFNRIFLRRRVLHFTFSFGSLYDEFVYGTVNTCTARRSLQKPFVAWIAINCKQQRSAHLDRR